MRTVTAKGIVIYDIYLKRSESFAVHPDAQNVNELSHKSCRGSH